MMVNAHIYIYIYIVVARCSRLSSAALQRIFGPFCKKDKSIYFVIVWPNGEYIFISALPLPRGYDDASIIGPVYIYVWNDGRPKCAQLIHRLHVRVLLRSDNWHWTHSQATLIRSSWHWECVEFGDTYCEHHKTAFLPTGRAIFAFLQMRSCPCDESSDKKKSKQIKMVNKWRWRWNPNRKLEHQMSTDGQPLAFQFGQDAIRWTLSCTHITIHNHNFFLSISNEGTLLALLGAWNVNHECGSKTAIDQTITLSISQMSNHPNINSAWLCRAIQYHFVNSATVTTNKKTRFAILNIYEYLEYWQWWAKWIESS